MMFPQYLRFVLMVFSKPFDGVVDICFYDYSRGKLPYAKCIANKKKKKKFI